MKKKETILIIIMGIITVAVIVMGYQYNEKRKAALLDHGYEAVSQTDSFEERRQIKEKEKRAKFLAAFDENRTENTVADFLQYVKYGKGETAVTFYGYIEDQAAWVVANASEEDNLQFVSLLDEAETMDAKMAELVETKPDVIFFHIPLPESTVIDWTWDGLPIEESNIPDIFLAYDTLKEELPETLIVLVTPAPAADATDTEEGGSIHQVGINEVIATSGEYALPVFNLHDQILADLTQKELPIASLYDEAGALTEEAQQLVSRLFIKSLHELKVDTNSAYHVEGEPAEIDIVLEVEAEMESVETESEEDLGEESAEEIIEEVEIVEEESSEEIPVWTPPASEESSSTWTPPASSDPIPPASSSSSEEESSSEESIEESNSSEDETEDDEPESVQSSLPAEPIETSNSRGEDMR